MIKHLLAGTAALLLATTANAATGDGEVGLATALGRHAAGVYADTVTATLTY